MDGGMGGMGGAGGAALAAQSVPDLGRLIIENDVRRSRRWRLQFLLVWLVILAGLIAFVALTVDLDAAFLTKVVPFIIGGVGVTLFVSLISISLAIVLATLGALGRLSRNSVANGIASFYVSLVRGTPLLLQIYFIFLALPQAGIVLDAIWCGIIALGFNYGAYMTEIFRAGVQAVPGGQSEAAASLGMDGRTTFLRIVAPQAFRIVIPAIGNDFIAMLKDSSLISAIGVQEILWKAQAAGRPTYQSMQTLLVAALVYWGMTLVFSYFQARLEKRQAVGDRAQGAR
ncbi:MAG TPA: amino acid ABC transporter permease [Candidatus Limnocylindrales bacterium]|nr:amino acid ABC transporter permease [Candidatus Limnocylindrales bacterium]